MALCLWQSLDTEVLMYLRAFRKLSFREQHELVAKAGVLLCERQSRNFLIFLYQIDGFYIELFFFKETGEFATIKAFDNLDELTPYLNGIDLACLLNE